MAGNDWNTRLSLLQRAKNPDDHHAWDEFTFYYSNFVKVVLSEMGVNQNDKDDLSQIVLISLWKALPKFELDKNKARFRTWMSTVIHNKVIDYYRKVNSQNNKNSKFWDDNQNQLTVVQPEIEKIIQNEWEVYVVQTALERIRENFSGKAMQVFEMSMDNVPTNEIAEKLDVAYSSVSKLKNRVKERLVVEITNLKSEMYLFEE
ncbi:sigma-70 family RNA polymerase sigma factor [Lentisphaera marina]|uniref:sigma-70 family RNA polymerase sigma factor n=1 Tax=Lentisphaera marina TaxID=1111041 RepID=UPI002366884D|nr:sigma-70 family RNA polymerase sigma factor [Lentisphaera marina]MDD7984641.1 sigma-70 family RNA polymerase sigma factor [Lentisphaera marina]